MKKLKTINQRALIWINIISFLVFIFVLFGVLYNFGFSKIDLIINSFMDNPANNFLISFFIAISFIFDPKIILVVSLILSAYMLIRFSKKDSLFFGFTMIFSAGFIYVLKKLVQRARPVNALVSENNLAFPSGHSLMAIVFFGFLIYFVYKYSKSRNLRLISVIVSLILTLLICLSRLYLNVHWFSDILGGIAMGTFILIRSLLLKGFSDRI